MSKKTILTIAMHVVIYAGLLTCGWVGHGEGIKTGFAAGVASVPHITALNPATGKVEPIPTPGGNVQIIVVGPSGHMEEGVVAGHTKDGSKVLVLPPSILAGPDQQDDGAPDTPQGLRATPNRGHRRSENPITKLA